MQLYCGRRKAPQKARRYACSPCTVLTDKLNMDWRLQAIAARRGSHAVVCVVSLWRPQDTQPDHPDFGRSEASKAPNLFEFVRLGCSQATCCGGMRLFRAIIRPDGGKAGR